MRQSIKFIKLILLDSYYFKFTLSTVVHILPGFSGTSLEVGDQARSNRRISLVGLQQSNLQSNGKNDGRSTILI